MKFQFHRIALRASLVTGLFLTFVLAIDIYARQSYEAINNSQLCKNLADGKNFARTELFFGLSKSDGSTISDQEFQQFIDRQITPLFPDGLTLLTGIGQFQNSSGTVVKEKSKLLVLLYPLSKNSNGSIEQIRAAYKTAFKQESVLRVDEQSCASF